MVQVIVNDKWETYLNWTYVYQRLNPPAINRLGGWTPPKIETAVGVPLTLEELYKKVIKEESQRRILEVYPEWKQSNLLLASIDAIASEDAKNKPNLDELHAMRDFIAEVRDSSNLLEGMDPKTTIVWQDNHWPAVPTKENKETKVDTNENKKVEAKEGDK